MKYETLFTPFKVRGLELKNRIILPGMNTKMAVKKHQAKENVIAYHAARAKSGCAMNIFEVCSICPEPHAYMYFGLYLEEDIVELKKITDAVHAEGGTMAVQLWHGGFSPQMFFDETNVLETPDNLSIERIQEIVALYGAAAANAVKAGFDAIEFHAAHSYLPHEFLSPGTNKRTDEYGGCFENRARFLWEIVEAIRENIPEEMPLFMRAGCIDEMMEAVLTEQEIVDFINGAADRGVDIADMSRGNAMSFATVYEVPPFSLPQAFNIDNINKIKQQIKIPVMAVGRFNDPAIAEKALVDGKCELVGIGRAQIADWDFVGKAMRGEDEKIRRCIGCVQGCYDAVIDHRFQTITCTRNPMACLEYKGLPKTEAAKKVMIIGGGMAGLLAAETLKARGHEPVIFEASDKLGGQFPLAGKAPMKHEFAAAAEWEVKQVMDMGIEVHLNTVVTPELIAEVAPAEVIIAIGSDYVAPAIPGVDGANVYSQYQVMKEEVAPTGKVAVVGCGIVGTEVAEFLAVKGAQVTVIEKKGVGNGLSMLRKMFQTPEFKAMKIAKMGGTNVVGIDGNTVHYIVTDRKTKEQTQGSSEFDSIVICTGITARPSDALVAKCEEMGIKAHVVGDAKAPRNSLWATREGYLAGMEI